MKTSRVIAFGVAIAALVVLLTGCGGSESSAPDPGIPFERAEAPASDMTLDEVYVQVVRDGTDIYDYDSDGSIVTLGHTVCEAFDHDLDFFRIVDAMGSSDDAQASYVVGAAVTAYCPEHKGAIGR